MEYENITVLRIYLRYGQKAENLTFWQKFRTFYIIILT